MNCAPIMAKHDAALQSGRIVYEASLPRPAMQPFLNLMQSPQPWSPCDRRAPRHPDAYTRNQPLGISRKAESDHVMRIGVVGLAICPDVEVGQIMGPHVLVSPSIVGRSDHYARPDPNRGDERQVCFDNLPKSGFQGLLLSVDRAQGERGAAVCGGRPATFSRSVMRAPRGAKLEAAA